MKSTLFLLFSVVFLSLAFAQEPPPKTFTRADTLRGMLRPERTCYKLNYEHLDVKIDPATQFITGTNTMRFRMDSTYNRMQVDLFANMKVDSIVLDGKTAVPYTREFNAVFLNLPSALEKGSMHEIAFAYSGAPQVAKRPPWDGGFTWRKDSVGNPWVCVTCQGTGASLWWPN
ncbi:MAG TPA: M1 family peptidase, partial [Bacteroidota bacterium]|nr:M1 family peptidase [Bacteroidota bacterium]